jgi:hypothetical protein
MFEIFNKISQLLPKFKKKSKISTLGENLDFFYSCSKQQNASANKLFNFFSSYSFMVENFLKTN